MKKDKGKTMKRIELFNHECTGSISKEQENFSKLNTVAEIS